MWLDSCTCSLWDVDGWRPGDPAEQKNQCKVLHLLQSQQNKLLVINLSDDSLATTTTSSQFLIVGQTIPGLKSEPQENQEKLRSRTGAAGVCSSFGFKVPFFQVDSCFCMSETRSSSFSGCFVWVSDWSLVVPHFISLCDSLPSSPDPPPPPHCGHTVQSWSSSRLLMSLMTINKIRIKALSPFDSMFFFNISNKNNLKIKFSWSIRCCTVKSSWRCFNCRKRQHYSLQKLHFFVGQLEIYSNFQ